MSNRQSSAFQQSSHLSRAQSRQKAQLARNDNFNPMSDLGPQQEKKGFEESIFLMGKILGKVRGQFTLSNMPTL